MNIPFTADQFLQVFSRYNQAVWPVQVLLVVVALVIVVLAWRGSGRWVLLLLTGLWGWMGLVYHWGFFTAINPAAWLFGALFIAQAVLLLVAALRHRTPSFAIRPDLFGIVGVVLVLYALVVYPLLGTALGHRYPASPTFGLPCPTTIFTFGLFLWARQRFALRLLVIPAIWSVIGFTAALNLSMREDYGLLVAGLGAAVMIAGRAWWDHRDPAQVEPLAS